MICKNLDDLFNHLEKQIQDTMNKEVADAAVDEMQKTIDTSVYDKYTPLQYNRRYDNGGLRDIHNIAVTEIENGITLKDVAPLDNGRTDYELDDIIVNRGVRGYPYGRDFYSDTVENLEMNGKVVNALEKGLKKRGVM